MSIRVLLTHYLSTLRERDELDALLPELLLAMGHNVLSRAQVGVPQGGVDVLSTFANAGDVEEAFLFIIKFGDISRENLYSGAQAIQPSVREASAEYVQNRLPAGLRAGRKRLVILSNGDWKQAAQSGFKVLSDEVETQPGCSLEFGGVDQLATLIETHLLNESLLLDAGRSHLRAAIATLDDSETSERHFRRFVDSVLRNEVGRASAPATRRRAFLKHCAAAEMGWAVLDIWGQSESNLKPSANGGEYLILRMWSFAVGEGLEADSQFIVRFSGVRKRVRKSLEAYFDRIWSQLLDPHAVMSYAHHEVLYAQIVLEEVGRLGLLALMSDPPGGASSAVADRILQLFEAHPGVVVPVFDGQAVDLSLALTGLMACGQHEAVSALVLDMSERLMVVARARRNLLPVSTDLLEDAIALRSGDVDPVAVGRISTLVPMLSAVSSFENQERALAVLRDEVVPNLPGMTLERWYPKAEIDRIASLVPSALPGVSRGLSRLEADCATEAAAALDLPQGAVGPAEVRCVSASHNFIIALSARVFRHPLPTWHIAQFSSAASAGARVGQGRR